MGGVSHPRLRLVTWEVPILIFLQQPPKAKSTPFARYRNTATLISLILDVGYECPHRTLDEYVEAFTGFRPTDGKEWTDDEPELPRGSYLATRISKLNFEKMSESSRFL